MPKKRSWTIQKMRNAVQTSGSIRQVLKTLGLRGTGGNYGQMHRYIKELNLDIKHFHGRAWNKGLKIGFRPKRTLTQILVKNSVFQSHQLRRRLIAAKLKPGYCEQCGWAQRAPDGRLPLELDHINGDRWDNRLENLRILCPNCHSLTPTYRRKKKHVSPSGVIGSHA